MSDHLYSQDYDNLERELVEVLKMEIPKAFESVGCDMRCFDWLNYDPDFYIEQKGRKVEDSKDLSTQGSL